MSASPTAVFDTLHIADRLTEFGDGVTAAEIHVFGYLARVLLTFDQGAEITWDYSFVGTAVGAPYSIDLGEAIDSLIANGLIEINSRVIQITERGALELQQLSSFSSYRPRIRYLSAACDSALALPLASVGEMLKGDPQLRTAIGLTQSRNLLDEAGLALLEPYLDGLREAVGAGSQVQRDLMAPAIVWLSYLGSEADRRATA